jgi:transcriptional regulator with XRE-family HTH domain
MGTAMSPPKADPDHGLAQAVRRLRTDRGLSQEQLAHRANLTTSVVGAIEGARSNPQWATVKAIAAAIEVPLAELAALSEKLDRKSQPESPNGRVLAVWRAAA